MEKHSQPRTIHATLAEAVKAHSEVKQACELPVASGQTVALHDLVGLWVELLGQTPDVAAASSLVQAAHWTIPVTLITELRCDNDIAVAFAFVQACSALRQHAAVCTYDAYADLMRGVWAATEQRLQQAAAVREGFGCDASESWLTMRRVEKAGGNALLQRLTVIAQLAGRMFDAMRVVTKPVLTQAPQSVVGVERGGQLDRLMPAEIAKLTVPGGMGDMQAMKVLCKDADQRRMAGERQLGRGPLVLVMDESSSMHDEVGNLGHPVPGRNSWAKAAALALTRLAHGEGRRVCAVHFSTTTLVHDVPVDDGPALERLLLTFLGGGTDFLPPMVVGCEQVQRLEREGFPGADLVYITDGEGAGGPAMVRQLNAMAQAGTRLWTVAIGQEIELRHPLRDRAERYVFAHDADLRSRPRALQLATELTAAAVPDAKRWN